jgi:hypothetical protein
VGRRFALFVCVCVLLGAAACGKPIRADEPTDGGDDAALLHQSFDDGRFDCVGFTGTNASIGQAEGRSGRACKVCVGADPPYFNIYAPAITAAKKNYVIQAWVKRDPTAPQAQVTVGFVESDKVEIRTPILAPPDWTHMAHPLLPSTNARLEPGIFGEGPKGSCFLVDDVVVTTD